MNFQINQNNDYPGSYTREEVQNLIDEKKIGFNTEIWTEQWGKWKQIRETDFNWKKAICVENINASVEDEAGVGWQILAFLVPIAGLIMFLSNRSDSPNKANRYARLAGFGIAFGAILRLIGRLQG
jgi:hypothetical protein